MHAKTLIALAAAAALLAGCGGGAEPAADTSNPAAASAGLRTALGTPAGRKHALAITPQQAAEQLFSFAQSSIYAGYFPADPATHAYPGTQSYPPFVYRAYSNGVLLGVVVTAGTQYTLNGVYVMGGPFGNSPQYVGLLADFITPVDPGPGPSGANNGCYDLALMETTGTHIEVAMQHSGDSTGTVVYDWTVTGPKRFESHADAIETLIRTTGTLMTDGGPASLDTLVKSYDKRTGDAEVTLYGFESSSSTSFGDGSMSIVAKTVFSPGSIDRQYALALGQSVTRTGTGTVTTTTTITAPGFPPAPTTNTTSLSDAEIIKLVARESVTVPAGRYDTCKFEMTFPDTMDTVTTWVIEGKGIAVKSITTTPGQPLLQEATSVKLNGASL